MYLRNVHLLFLLVKEFVVVILTPYIVSSIYSAMLNGLLAYIFIFLCVYIYKSMFISV